MNTSMTKEKMKEKKTSVSRQQSLQNWLAHNSAMTAVLIIFGDQVMWRSKKKLSDHYQNEVNGEMQQMLALPPLS